MGETQNTKRLGALVVACALALTAGGCATTQTTPTATPTPTQANSESAQLAEAVDAFTVFNAVLDGYVGGTKTVNDFEPLVTPEYFAVLVEEDTSRDTTTRTVGASSFSDQKLVDPDDWGGFGDLALVVCRDISRASVVDANGAPSTVVPLRTRIPMIVYLVASPDTARPGLLISKADQWNEDGYCS